MEKDKEMPSDEVQEYLEFITLTKKGQFSSTPPKTEIITRISIGRQETFSQEDSVFQSIRASL